MALLITAPANRATAVEGKTTPRARPVSVNAAATVTSAIVLAKLPHNSEEDVPKRENHSPRQTYQTYRDDDPRKPSMAIVVSKRRRRRSGDQSHEGSTEPLPAIRSRPAPKRVAYVR